MSGPNNEFIGFNMRYLLLQLPLQRRILIGRNDNRASKSPARCLTTNRSGDGISSFFRGDLFHVNGSKHPGTFMEQLEQDIRVLRRTDMGEVLLKKKPGVPSGNDVEESVKTSNINEVQYNFKKIETKISEILLSNRLIVPRLSCAG